MTTHIKLALATLASLEPFEDGTIKVNLSVIRDALREIKSLESTIKRILALIEWEAQRQGELACQYTSKLLEIAALLDAPKGEDL